MMMNHGKKFMEFHISETYIDEFLVHICLHPIAAMVHKILQLRKCLRYATH